MSTLVIWISPAIKMSMATTEMFDRDSSPIAIRKRPPPPTTTHGRPAVDIQIIVFV